MRTDPIKLLRKKFMIGAVNVVNPRIQFFTRQRAAPYLTKTGQATRDKTKSAARTAIGTTGRRSGFGLEHCGIPPRSADHIPVDIVMRAVQIEHGARSMGHQQPGSGSPRHADCKLIDVAILQPKLRQFLVSHFA